tara:strand:+ start:25 stop:222 length:198 start_codon:yes stop_codon:yes gene_type:complete
MKLNEIEVNQQESKAVKFIALSTDLNSSTKSIDLLYALDTLTKIDTKKVSTIKIRLLLQQIENNY